MLLKIFFFFYGRKKEYIKRRKKNKAPRSKRAPNMHQLQPRGEKIWSSGKGGKQKKNRKRITNNPASIIQRKQAANWLLWNLLKIFVRESLMFSMNLIIENQ